MKKLALSLVLTVIAFAAFAQDDEYQKFIEAQQKQMQEQQNTYSSYVTDKTKEYDDYVAKQNAEFAEFVAKDWELFNEFKKDPLGFKMPKLEKAPVAKEPTETFDKVKSDVSFKREEELPKVTHTTAVSYKDNEANNTYLLRNRVGNNGVVEVPAKNIDFSKYLINNGTKTQNQQKKVDNPVVKDETVVVKKDDKKPAEKNDIVVKDEVVKKDEVAVKDDVIKKEKEVVVKKEEVVVKTDDNSIINEEKKLAPAKNNNELTINFYGREVKYNFDPKLRIKSKSVEEKNVADYFTDIAKCRKETGELWNEISKTVDDFGLNEWGYFCLVRSISEQVFTNINDRVLFCFYMLRNEGNFKTRLARGKESGNLTLLLALDNSKQVYSYTFFRFADNENGSEKVKYYTVYGGGKAKESVYSYGFSKQDCDKKQMRLDFTKNMNMGPCDITRTLQLTKDKSVTLPYNTAHIAYFNDVPMTVFPIYFVNPISIEAQQVLDKTLKEMRDQYNPTQFIQMLLTFVQKAFEYKTDEEQFGYEKYFYPEEVIGYPYCDCEDRSALFAWLVQKYTNAKVVGLQYEGHMATAVCFGDNVNIKGDAIEYANKRYYVCDPTYINASIGMTMPQFKNAKPKVVKINR